jgi:hypothetical protein
MSQLPLGMIVAGVVALLAGLLLARERFSAASGAGKILVLGPVFEAVALAIFAAEHFLDARDLAGIVPRADPHPKGSCILQPEEEMDTLHQVKTGLKSGERVSDL